jgi:hypothetical protein
MGIKAGNGNAGKIDPTPLKKLGEQSPHPHDFSSSEQARHLLQRHMSSDQGHGEGTACQQHGVVRDLGARSEKLRLSGKFKTCFMQMLLTDRSGDHSSEFARECTPSRFLQAGNCTQRPLTRWNPRIKRRRITDNLKSDSFS